MLFHGNKEVVVSQFVKDKLLDSLKWSEMQCNKHVSSVGTAILKSIFIGKKILLVYEIVGSVASATKILRAAIMDIVVRASIIGYARNVLMTDSRPGYQSE